MASKRQTTSELRVFGIRHHGPGSARSLRRALTAFAPDAVLIEGPPDAADILPLAADREMRPPVALLVYRPDAPQRAAYFPFARFSPEWQALDYALASGINVRLIDLPQAHQLTDETDDETDEAETGSAAEVVAAESDLRRDPLRRLAEAAGYDDSERWWEHLVEERRSDADLFAAVEEAMAALREDIPFDLIEARREAHMRQMIRAAEREGFARIAVVCGAWHAPALTRSNATAREDAELLKGLPRVNVAATWTPWTHGRLTAASGYRAGVHSPGWYEHLWDSGEADLDPTAVTIGWMARVARLLRDADLDASSAQVIEAVRLAESLAALRSRPLPGLSELTEATQTVLCFGNDAPLRLIHEKLIVGERLGVASEAAPTVPLQRDLQREQRRLRLPAEAASRDLDLDLRKPNDLERSHLLHRLSLLGIAWGALGQAKGKSGTFHELWTLQWRPEFAVAIVEASAWGNTIIEAATGRVNNLAEQAEGLPVLAALVDRAILADLPDAIAGLIGRVQTAAAIAPDIAHLMDALPPLVNVSRYGSVRRIEAEMLSGVVAALLARISIGLPGACSALNDEAAAAMAKRLREVDQAVALIADEAQPARWREALAQLSDRDGLHGLVAGRCCRLLLAAGVFAPGEAAQRFGLALSAAVDPAQAAAWIEGFLEGSGTLLVHEEALWRIIDEWLTEIPVETFPALLPLLRRTFATFSAPERRQLGERARRESDGSVDVATGAAEAFDHDRASVVLPMLAMLLGRGDK